MLVAAAGNSGNSGQTYPAAYPEVLGAAGTNPDDTLNSYSNYGSWVKVAAPWCNYGTSMRQADGSYRYASFCGTSSATPAVAGIAALAFSYQPGVSNTDVERAVESSTFPVVGSHQVAYGRIDAYGALLALGAGGGSAPANTSLPSISGTPQDGQSLTASAGTWTGSTPMTYAYQWQRCDSAGANCASVSGASASSYALTSADLGSTMRVNVTGSNAYGTRAAVSAQTTTVTGAPPPPPPGEATTTFTGTLNKKQGSRAFGLTVGAGAAQANLQFSKAPSLTLTLLGSDGATIATASGPSIVQLVRSLGAGSYQYVVTSANSSSASFSLTVTYCTP